MPNDKQIVCHFCGRTPDEAGGLIKGNLGGLICADCVNAIDKIVKDKQRPKPQLPFNERTLPKPKEIKAFLDKYVIGQEEAKITVSVAVYNHYKRVLHYLNRQPDDVELEKSNILMIGPTGVGKTLIALTLARMLHVPFAIADATTLTEAGYVGEDVENIIVRLLQNAAYHPSLTELGIVYIDELDKIGRKSENPSLTRDVSGEGVQQALLKLIEGTDAMVPPEGGRKHPEQPLIKIDTRNILFIAGGHFEGLSKIVARRTAESVIGFEGRTISQIPEQDFLKLAEPDDLMKFGLIPELVGRIPIIVSLAPLDSEALKRILIEPKNALLRQYAKLFEMENIELLVDEEAVDAIVEEAKNKHTGARALKSIIERIFTPITFGLSTKINLKKVIITKDVVMRDIEPVYVVAEDIKDATQQIKVTEHRTKKRA